MTQVRLTVILAVLMLPMATRAGAQALPIPGVDAARDVPGAKEMPNTSIVHKVVFDMGTANPKPNEPHPLLQAVARYVNTLAKTGVPAANRKVAVVFHQGATDYVLKNDVYKARHEGQDNPNEALMQAMVKAGVDMRLCGQASLARKVEPADMQPGIQRDLWALTTIIALVQQGYVLVQP